MTTAPEAVSGVETAKMRQFSFLGPLLAPSEPRAPCIRMGGMKDNFVFECFDQNNGLNPPDKVRQSHSNLFWGVWGCFWGSSLFWGVLCISAKLRFWPELTYPLDKIENGVRFCSGRIQVTLKHFTGVLYNIMRYIDQRLCVKGTHRGWEKGPFGLKSSTLGEKLLSAPGHPANVRSTIDHCNCMGSTNIMHRDPFLGDLGFTRIPGKFFRGLTNCCIWICTCLGIFCYPCGEKCVRMHNISVSHHSKVFCDDLGILRVTLGPRRLFSQWGMFGGGSGPI